jgi:branched-chain amino acid transport system substrate-binding protein
VLGALGIAGLLAGACGDDDSAEGSTNTTVAGESSSPSTASGEPYRIGIIVSLTGPANALGAEEIDSFHLAVNAVNEAGGINGHPIETIEYDDESDPQTAVTLTQRLITEDNVHAIMGGLSSSATLAVKPVVEELGVALLSAHVAVATTEDDPRYLFRAAPSDAMSAQKMLEYIDGEGFTDIAILHDSNAYGSGARDLVNELLADFPGIEVVATESYNNEDTDMRTQLTSIQSASPEALLVLGTGQGPALAIGQAGELGLDAAILGGTGLISPATIEIAGDAASNMVAVGYGDPNCPRPEQEAFVEQFREAYGRDPVGFNYLGDGMYLILEALRDVEADPGDVDAVREELRDAIEAIDGISWGIGPWSFAPDNHDGVGSDSLVLMSVQDGEWRRLDCE